MRVEVGDRSGAADNCSRASCCEVWREPLQSLRQRRCMHFHKGHVPIATHTALKDPLAEFGRSKSIHEV
eukprot:2550757-Alexandrium_andersonii.AAC.1